MPALRSVIDMEICVMSGKNIRSNCLFEREPFSFQLALSPVHENIIDPLLSVIFFHGDVIFVELRSENIAASRFGHCVRRLVTAHTQLLGKAAEPVIPPTIFPLLKKQNCFG